MGLRSLVFRFFLGDRIIAAGAKGIAPKDTPNGKSETDKKASFFKCLKSVLRAGRGKPTAGTSLERG